ncbi:hypothetical protein L7F22_060172 [Adiantum nelumboides]|nr:hypothetical protein [Adiantum nelumboides]
MNVATSPASHVDSKNSSRRLVYRFLMHLISIKKITCLLDICKAWTIISPPTYSMYTSTIFRERNDPDGAFLLTDWERKHCPWWVDMKKGECLEEEKEMYLCHLKGECKSNSGSSGEMTEEQRKKMEVELKAFKDKEEQEREVLGKNCGCPPSSKGDMPIKDKRNLASPLAHKNVGKGVLLHATSASFNFLKKQGKIKNSKVWNYDYIELGKEFSTRNFKDGFAVMRDFYVGFGGGPKTRNARPSTWSVDLSVIDLPTGGEVTGFDGIPSWNVLTDDHVKFSLW